MIIIIIYGPDIPCAQRLYQLVGKSRQALPQPSTYSSHGKAVPQRLSCFGDGGASLLGCRLCVRRPAKANMRRDANRQACLRQAHFLPSMTAVAQK